MSLLPDEFSFDTAPIPVQNASARSAERTRLGLPAHPTVVGTASIAFLLGVLGLAVLWLEPAYAPTMPGVLVALVGLLAFPTGIKAMRMHGPAASAAHALATMGVVFGSLAALLVAYSVIASLLSAHAVFPVLPGMR